MRLLESLYILTHTYYNITNLAEVIFDNKYHPINPYSDNLNEKHMFHFISSYNYAIMECCSFLEEYDKSFYQLVEEEYKDRILVIKKIVKPAVNRIRAWKDMKKFRNDIVAHPWRHFRTNEFTYRKIFDYNSPRSYIELDILRRYLMTIVGVLEIEFANELQQLPLFMLEIHKIKPVPPRQSKDYYYEMIEAIKNINDLSEAEKKNYRLVSEKIIG